MKNLNKFTKAELINKYTNLENLQISKSHFLHLFPSQLFN